MSDYIDNNKIYMDRDRSKDGCVEYSNGSKEYYLNGKWHRLDGPAIEHANGDKYWLVNDRLHREDGPAIELANGKKYWFLNGIIQKSEC